MNDPQWGGAFNHSRTAFPLSGAHLAVPCSECHTGNRYRGTPAFCYACHADDYTGTLNPAHASGGFSTECVACHSTAAWHPASFDHSKTAFPLTGAHAAVPCTQCHAGGQYAGTPSQCSSCHLTDYNQATNPVHASAGFPLDCQSCHTTAAWRPASFDHNRTAFPLTGAHIAVSCAQCHVGGQYAGTPAACSGCHLTDYNQTTNPAHASAGFPLDCQSCHTTGAWVPSTFDHDTYFPISAGSRHAPGRWHVCSDCHTVATNFAVYSCITCHGQASTDSKHSGVRNYRYDSQACYQCHPRGIAG